MAVNDDPLDRDPELAGLLATAGGESPPAALDAAILAAARREVSARPQAAAGGGTAAVAAARAKRNWYVPVSIAAVLVLSVSLVTLVHEEKGGELAQPPSVASTPPKVPAVAAGEVPTVPKSDTALSEAAPARTPATQDKPIQSAAAPAAPKAAGELAKRRADEAKPPTDSGAVLDTARKEQSAGVTPRPQVASEPVAPASARGAPSEGAADARAPVRQKQIEAFPGAVEREAQVPAAPAPPPAIVASPVSPPVQSGREALEGRARNEADRSLPRGALQDAPVAKAAAVPAPRVAEETQTAPSIAESRVFAPAKPAARPAPASKPTMRLEEKRAPVWLGLENLPPERWLERMAEFKREGRNADAEEMLGEFKRRFPDHPASAR